MRNPGKAGYSNSCWNPWAAGGEGRNTSIIHLGFCTGVGRKAC
jgi:hypothetical protein